MQKIIIDTNVLVSALIQKAYPYLILKDCVLDNKVELCVSESIMNEYFEVLKRPKFLKYPEFVLKAEELLADISGRATLYFPQIVLDVIKDSDDNKFLELAHACHANFLITGNTNHFTLENY
jgi:putative PIN family toxin of toxin-antitoxin system